MNAQDLKNSILQLAIQGKLVEQREEEGTAKELLQQIEVEKEQLLKDKIIKKRKPLPEISADEIPFDIPESWEWVSLNQIAIITGGYAFKSTNFSDVGIRVIRISDFNERGFVNTKIVKHTYNDSLEMFLVNVNDILLCMTGGTVGKSLFVKEITEPIMTNQRVATIKIIDKVIPDYINYTILSPVIQSIIKSSKNSTNDNISMNTIKEFPIPLPPIEEQKRIVAKIEELMPFLDKYDKAYSEVVKLNKKFPEDVQKSILQYAVQGNLVEQREEDGTAEELYKQIQGEKKKLIAEGKIKKTKALPEITEDEIPFEIPESWKWVRFGDVMINRNSERIPLSVSQREKLDKIYDYYGASGVIDKVDNYIFDEKLMLIGEDGANLLTRSKPIAFIADGKYWVNNHAHVIGCGDYVLLEYVMYYINAISLAKFVTGTAQPKMNQANLNSIPVPLAPLEEQKRIVNKIEVLLPYTKQRIKF